MVGTSLKHRCKRAVQRFGDDERAVSPVVGFVLIFAFVMIVFTLYQTNVVPAQNGEVEFGHSQTVEKQLSELNDAIGQAGASGVPQSMTVATGVQYPDRALAINPGNPAGTLATSDPQTVTVSGLNGDSGYWNDDPTFDTRLVNYRSNYNVMQQEPTYTLENGMRATTFESGTTLLRSDGGVFANEGQRINLVLVGGDYQSSSMTTSVTATPVSTSTEYHQLEPDGSATVTLPTTLPRSKWEAMLDGVGVSHDGKDHVSLGSYTPGNPGTVTIALDSSRTYDLRVSKVILGGSESPELTYLKAESERINRTAAVGTPETFTVSARDEFGNAYSGALVDATTDGSGTFSRSNGSDVADVATGNDGQATVTYTPGEADAGNTTSVTLTLDDGSVDADRRTVTYNITVPPNTDENNDNSSAGVGFGEITNGYDIDIIITDVTPGNGNDDPMITFENLQSQTATATAVRISGFSVQGQIDSGDNITFAGKEIPFNANEVSLGGNEFDVPGDGTKEVGIESIGNQGGFLIMDIRFERGGGTEVGTYAVSVPG